MDKVLGLATPGRRLDQLLPHPGRGRARGHVEVHDLATIVGDEEEDVESPEPYGLHDEEVSGPDSLELVGWLWSPAWLRRAGRSTPTTARAEMATEFWRRRQNEGPLCDSEDPAHCP